MYLLDDNLRHEDMYRLYLFVVMMVLTVGLSASDTLSVDPCQGDRSSYIDGEQLVYIVYYQLGFAWIPAGEVVIQTVHTDSIVKVDITGKTFPSYNSFFEVDDFFSTAMEEQSGLPLSFVRRVKEGSYTKFDSISFDQSSMRATSIVGKTESSAKTKEIAVDGCMHDMISSMYLMRSLPLESMQDGQGVAVRLLLDGDVYEVGVEYAGAKKKKIKHLGRQLTHHLRASLIEGEVFGEGTTMNIYVKQGRYPLPLMIESPLSVGRVKAILRSAQSPMYEHTLPTF